MMVDRVTKTINQPIKKIDSIDKLKFLFSDKTKNDSEALLKSIVDNEEFWQEVLKLKRFFKTHPKASFDVHSSNVMKRSDGTWVITDPASPTGKTIGSNAVELIFNDPIRPGGTTKSGRKSNATT